MHETTLGRFAAVSASAVVLTLAGATDAFAVTPEESARLTTAVTWLGRVAVYAGILAFVVFGVRVAIACHDDNDGGDGGGTPRRVMTMMTALGMTAALSIGLALAGAPSASAVTPLPSGLTTIFQTILDWMGQLVMYAGIAAVIIFGIRLALAVRRGEGGEMIGHFVQIVVGCALAAGAGGVVHGFLG